MGPASQFLGALAGAGNDGGGSGSEMRTRADEMETSERRRHRRLPLNNVNFFDKVCRVSALKMAPAGPVHRGGGFSLLTLRLRDHVSGGKATCCILRIQSVVKGRGGQITPLPRKREWRSLPVSGMLRDAWTRAQDGAPNNDTSLFLQRNITFMGEI